jgi:hypothetical protein
MIARYITFGRQVLTKSKSQRKTLLKTKLARLLINDCPIDCTWLPGFNQGGKF